MATCPKCRRRFHFRQAEAPAPVQPSPVIKPEPGKPQIDLWDAVDSLHERWEQEGKFKRGDIARPGGHSAGYGVAPGPEDAPLPEEMPRPEEAPERREMRPESVREDMPDETPENTAEGMPEINEAETWEETRPSGTERPGKPMRDLGRLDDNTPWGEGPENWKGGRSEEKFEKRDLPDVPWESPGQFGRPGALMSTIMKAMLDPKNLFSRIRSGGSLVPGLVFYLLLDTCYAAMYVLWMLTLQETISVAPEAAGQVTLHFDMSNISMLLLIIPVAATISLGLISGVIHQTMRLLLPEKADFSVTFRVVAYASAPMLLAVVPFIGPMIAPMMFLLLMFIGFRYAHDLTWYQSATCVLPFILLNMLASFFLMNALGL